MPLLSSIIEKWRIREETHKQERDEEKKCEMVPSGEQMEYL
jgi:hypothetical protein